MSLKTSSLALDLAKQAANAALAEVQEAQAPTNATAALWQPAKLPSSFHLAPALQQAVQHAARHLDQWLHHEGLEVATTPHSSQENSRAAMAVEIREQGDGRLVRDYSESAVLGLFANQQQRKGVVIDGQV
jgi:hypothetical protein